MTKIDQIKFNFKKNFVVNYHYVRPIRESKFPGVNGLEIDKFTVQLDLLEKMSRIVCFDEFSEVYKNDVITVAKKPICLLTFDDGLKDHIEFVLPELLKRNLTGVFFISTGPLMGKPLEVNKIQFILHHVANYNFIMKDIMKFTKEHKTTNIFNFEKHLDRFDTGMKSQIKSFLQRGLPLNQRSMLISELFNKYVGLTDKEFVNYLFLDKYDVSQMANAGMYIGYHSENHHRFSDLDEPQAFSEVKAPIHFFQKNIEPSLEIKSVAYPFGDSIPSIRDYYLKNGVSWGFNTIHESIDDKNFDPMQIPRWDTNNILV